MAKKAKTPLQIGEALSPSMQTTLLEEAGYGSAFYAVRAHSSGSARHALGRRGLLKVGQTVPAPTTFTGFHTPIDITPEGTEVADALAAKYGLVKKSSNPAEQATLKQLDRAQKRAKGWVRKWVHSEDYAVTAPKLIEKLRKLLQDEVEPLGRIMLSQAEVILEQHRTSSKLFASAQKHVEHLRELVEVDLPRAVEDPAAYADASYLTYGEKGSAQNTIQHLEALAARVFETARSVESTTTILRRQANPESDVRALKSRLLR